jgi:hypothetical protein
MAGEPDATEFVDPDFVAHNVAHKIPYVHSAPPKSSPFAQDSLRAPNREEVDRKVADAQQKLAELKRAQEDLERERATLEELRRRQNEFQTGRQEIIQNLTRGVGLLEEAEFTARRDAEQMARTLTDFRAALAKVQAIREEKWSKDSFTLELTRGLTAVENARMEWNSARLKLPVLAGENAPARGAAPEPVTPAALAALPFGQLCKLGLAFTLPLVGVGLLALGAFLLLLARH